ncbi:alanine racemase [Devosia sp.]|uniref:alanine racemase n=1 Tax=Devosia sp. TaxID=1871048 RepID=UPI00260CEDE2|nr:alanine racemase [Devosia sp.]
MNELDFQKGLPAGGVLHRPANLLAVDGTFPVAAMRRSAIRHNLDWMVRYCAKQGIAFAPHGKTPMIPATFHWQMNAGAFAISLADMRQVRVAVAAGIQSILLANEVIGAADIAELIDILITRPGVTFYCLVDSVEGVRRLGSAARTRGLGRPIEVLLEGGMPGGRCGVRSVEAGRVVLAELAYWPELHLRGIEGYEGVIKPSDDNAQTAVANYIDFLSALAREAEVTGLFDGGEILLSAGGTKFHDIVVDRFKSAGLRSPSIIVIRSGCYLFHDHGIYAAAFNDMVARSAAALHAGVLQPALEVWAQVLSRPEEGIVILNAGKRDCPYDAGMPTVLKAFRPESETWLGDVTDHAVFALHDQHGYVRVPPSSPLQVGDLVGLGISHPCTLFDKWRTVLEIDDDYNILDVHETHF